jgi:imidazolonepropionase-like amidohydrolase
MIEWPARRAGIACVLLLALAFAHAATAETVAFFGATVIDLAAGRPMPDAVVVVEDGRIAAVGADAAVPDGARRIELAGKWLIPGLIDAHVHLFQSGGLYARPDVIDLRQVVAYDDEIARVRRGLDETLARTFAAGVTGILDLGGPEWIAAARARAEAADMPAPRIAWAGQLLASWAPAELRTDPPPVVLVETPVQARAEVRRQAALGADLIKVWFIRARGDQDFATTRRWAAAAIEEAHAMGLRAAVHATELETAKAALAAGADALVHSVDDHAVDERFVQAMRARDVLYMPTLGVYDGYWRVLRQKLGLTALDRRYGAPWVLDTLDDLKSLPPAAVPDWLDFEAAVPPINTVMIDNLARVHAAGITVAAGSDAGNIGTLHGAGLHKELRLMARAGLTPAEILRSATLAGARAMGRGEELGLIAPGRRADMVALDADPLADVAHLARIHRVIKAGVVYDPAELLATYEPENGPRR